jgi:hypothetical protein
MLALISALLYMQGDIVGANLKVQELCVVVNTVLKGLLHLTENAVFTVVVHSSN